MLCLHNLIYVTQSDKKGLIAGKYICSLNNMYLKFSIRYYNSVTFSKLSINFYISGKSLNSYHVCTKSYKISNFEIIVKILTSYKSLFVRPGHNFNLACNFIKITLIVCEFSASMVH